MEVLPHALYTNTAQAIAAVFCGFTKELYITYEVNKRAHVYVMNPESWTKNFRGSLQFTRLFFITKTYSLAFALQGLHYG